MARKLNPKAKDKDLLPLFKESKWLAFILLYDNAAQGIIRMRFRRGFLGPFALAFPFLVL